MSDSAAVDAIHADNARRIAALTSHEREVLILSAKGLTQREIATTLCRSMHTAMGHRKAILRKLDVSTIIEAAVIAAKVGVV